MTKNYTPIREKRLETKRGTDIAAKALPYCVKISLNNYVCCDNSNCTIKHICGFSATGGKE